MQRLGSPSKHKNQSISYFVFDSYSCVLKIVNLRKQEIVAALASQCNIIPIMDNFIWPDPQDLPEDIQAVLSFNGVKYGFIHINVVFLFK